MPIYQLTDKLVFPHPYLANEDGILAIGGDLSVERLLLAYENGIFPWYNEGEPIIWHAPNPRFVLYPSELKISKSMSRILRNKQYKVSINTAFECVLKNCQNVRRKEQDDTWITNEMGQAYQALHKKGYAHSVEVWNTANELVGGLYGVNIGTVFYGESMFHLESNTSKIAFITLLQNFEFSIIDCQVYTKHLESLGAKEVEIEEFYECIVKENKNPNVLNRNINFVTSQ